MPPTPNCMRAHSRCNRLATLRRTRCRTMTCVFTVALALLSRPASAQESALIPDSTVPIPQLRFDRRGALDIRASATSSARDFDYLVGTWKLRNRRLKARLAKSTEWVENDARVEMHQILNGIGNIDKFTDSSFGQPYEGVALRLFNPKTRLWSIHWADSNLGVMDPPLVGSFENKIGHFFGRDTFRGKPIIVVFRWDVRDPTQPIWSQAFSQDNGKTWEWNTINVSRRGRD